MNYKTYFILGPITKILEFRFRIPENILANPINLLLSTAFLYSSFFIKF